jgi:two-component system chemotaxis sensor kinase CheA
MPSNEPFAEFLDDYYVECDEHLTLSRRCLLSLEASVDRPHVDPDLLNDLFRSFHSIKGLSAMVGMRDAERLAHQMESYLSGLRNRRLRLSAAGFEALLAGVSLLEQVIASQRESGRPPDVDDVVQRFDRLLVDSAQEGDRPTTSPQAASQHSASLPHDKQLQVDAALASGARAWWITFLPSQELSARDINVNTVRERLQRLGQLVQAVPKVGDSGQIAFSFLVAGDIDETAFEGWQDEGLSFDPYEAEVTEPTVEENVSPAEESIPDAAQVPTRLMPSNLVRVDLARLDHLMQLVGELVVSRSRLDDNLKQLGARLPRSDWRSLQETNQSIERQLRDLREGMMRIRLVPIREIFARMQFVVRDLNREYQKQTVLELIGQETEIDKFLVERMMDPLLHLVRNAIAHGLESADERIAAGKPAAGQIWLRATATGETIVIEVEDDGRGIDAQAVLARARSAGVTVLEGETDETTLLDILCSPGFSTRDEADRVSGRGVGMAVVRSTVEELAGTLTLQTSRGRGTRFTIQLPLTLAIADSLIVEVAGQMFAVPQVSVREVLHLDRDEVTSLENNELIRYREGVLPLVRLASIFNLPRQNHRMFYAIVVGTGLSAVAIGIDRVVGLREIVVRPMSDPLVRVAGISGATELGDGRVVLILDASMLSRANRKSSLASTGVIPVPALQS